MLGLEIGGDDYVTKPFSPRELVARVNVILRRVAPAHGRPRRGRPHCARRPARSIRTQHVASFAGTPLTLTAIEFGILRAFLTPADRRCSTASRSCARPISSTSRSPTAPSTATSATSAPSSPALDCDNVDRDHPRRRLQARPLREAGMSSAAPDKWRPSLGLDRLRGAGDRGRAAAGRPVLLPPLRQPADPPDPGRADRAEPRARRRSMRRRSRHGSAAASRSAPRCRRNARPDPGDQFTPIRPALDLTADDLLRAAARRASRASRRPQPAYVEIGARLTPIIRETQKVTLAGFRILDPQGVVIAGRAGGRAIARPYRGGR